MCSACLLALSLCLLSLSSLCSSPMCQASFCPGRCRLEHPLSMQDLSHGLASSSSLLISVLKPPSCTTKPNVVCYNLHRLCHRGMVDDMNKYGSAVIYIIYFTMIHSENMAMYVNIQFPRINIHLRISTGTVPYLYAGVKS